MKKAMLGLYRGTGLLVGIAVAICMAAVLGVGIKAPANHLIPWQMAVGTILGTMLAVAAFFIADVFSDRKSKSGRKGRVWYPVVLLLYGLLLYLLGCFHRNSPDSFVDYGVIYRTAMEFAEHGEWQNSGYFLIYPNNFKMALYLSVIFRAGKVLGFSDPYYFALGIGVLQVVAAMWAADDLLHALSDHARYRWLLTGAFVCLLPVYANSQAFYTDQMSYWQTVCALALLRRALQWYKKRKGMAIAAAVIAGILCALGYTVKATAVIAVIAAAIVWFLWKSSEGGTGDKFFPLLISVICCVVALVFFEAWAGGYEVYRESKNTGNPLSSWIAIGLTGRGCYGEDPEYSRALNALPTKAEKEQLTEQYIKEHRENFWSMDHLLAKLNCNFADGSLGTKDYTYLALYPGNAVYELFSPWGRHYWRTQQLCFVYLFTIYCVYLLGAVVSVIRWFVKRQISAAIMFVQLNLLGNILFLMLWEANNRQLYNQMPVILLGGVLNLALVKDFLKEQMADKK